MNSVRFRHFPNLSVTAVGYAHYRTATEIGLACPQRAECLKPASYFRVIKSMQMPGVMSLHLFQRSQRIYMYTYVKGHIDSPFLNGE